MNHPPLFTTDIEIGFGAIGADGYIHPPHYFSMIQTVVERFFSESLRVPFTQIAHEAGCAVTLRSVNVNFICPGTPVDKLSFTLQVCDVDRRNVTFEISASHNGRPHLDCTQTLCWRDQARQQAAWPKWLSARLASQRIGGTDAEGAASL